MLEDLSRYPRLRISRLNKLVTNSLNKAFLDNGFDITNEQEIILRNLRKYGPMSLKELAHYTGQDRHNLSRTIAILERKQLVTKIADESDKRFCQVSITRCGEATHQKLWLILEKWRAHAFTGISAENLAQFSRTAEEIMQNLKKGGDMKL